MVRSLLLVLLTFGLTASALAQTVPQGQVSVLGLYQRFNEDTFHVSEFSAPIQATVRFNRSFSASLATSPAVVSGSDVESLSGLSDAQLSMSYRREVGLASLIVGLRSNLPSGRRELSIEEFQTAFLASQNYYNFRVPTLGQGFSVSPSLTWVMPLSETLALGLGASYQLKGAYNPLEEGLGEYDPGDEILVLAGLDVRINDVTSISLDATYTTYGTDTIGETQEFDAGDKITGTLQFRRYFGFDELRLLARFRTRGEGTLFLNAEEFGSAQTVPEQFDAIIRYRARLQQPLFITFTGHARIYGETETLAGPVIDSQTLFDLIITPQYRLSPGLGLQAVAGVTVGSLTGYQGGFGLTSYF
ncbi:MAG: hypothetical protein AAGI71_15195 [Bacteroidota bacterium]